MSADEGVCAYDLQEFYKMYEKLEETVSPVVCIDLQYQKYRRDTAVQILVETDEVPILKSLDEQRTTLVQTLQEELRALKADVSTQISDAVADLRAHNAALKAAVTEKELEHKASVADLKAEANQASKEVAALQAQINDQRTEIREQRKLTQSVAEASKQGAIQQSFGAIK